MRPSELDPEREEPAEEDNAPLPTTSRIDNVDAVNGRSPAWQYFNLLSLDGGGIRGLWTLLALQRLFDFIANLEEEADKEVYTSFHPERLPENVSQVPLTDEERRPIELAYDPNIRARNQPQNRRYLPCHYFDHICGSSTGALIAIMLGRLRMTIPDCIFEYRTLAQEVFGKPRLISTLRFGLGVREKYKAERVEKVFRNVSIKRNEQPEPGEMSKIIFAYGRGLCATFVTSMESEAEGLSQLHLIRSYDHYERDTPTHSTRPTPSSTWRSVRVDTDASLGTNATQRKNKHKKNPIQVNYGKASQLEVWEVARAATAAKFYFKPLKIANSRGRGFTEFTDGGIGRNNNPTRTGKHEIEDLHGSTSVGIVVSVGTARKQKRDAKRAKFLSTIPDSAREFADEATDPEVVHRDMQRDYQRKHEFPYFRLNHPGGLQCELDEWKPKPTLYNKMNGGKKTVEAIETAFAKWAQNTDNNDQLKDCAAALVKCRRERMFTSKWERYATGSQYECRIRGCDPGDFFERSKFESHLKGHKFEGDALKEELNKCRKHWRYQAAPNTH